MQSLARTLLMTLVITITSIISFAQTTTSTATVTSDKPDYAPRSNAVFTGAGFQPGETVSLKVKNISHACNTIAPDSSYLPWSVVADASGGFVTNWTVCDCNGDSLRLRAVGQTSHDTAYVYFSDAAVTNFNIGTGSGSANYPASGSFTYNFNISANGSSGAIPVTMGISGLPAGFGATFTPATFNINTGETQAVSLTITSPANTNAGSYPFSVTAGGKSSNGTISIGKGTQTISFNTLPVKAVGDADFSPGATASSGLTVSYASGNTSVATIVSGKIHIVGTGTSIITASQGGDGNYNAATNVTQTLTVVNPSTLSVSTVSGNFNGTANLSATLTSNSTAVNNKSISFTLNGTSVGSATTNASGVATLSNVSLSGINAGTYNTAIGASFAGDATYATSSGTGALTVNQITPSVSIIGSASYPYNGSPQGPVAASNSGTGNTYTFTYSGTGSTSYSASTPPTNAGSYTVTATVAADGNYKAGTSNAFAFTITQASSTTTVTSANTTYDGATHGATATVTGAGGLSQSVSITYTGVSPTVYSSSTAPNGAGTYTATATYAGDANHTGSTDAKNFTIAQADANISITPYTVGYDGNSHTAIGTATGVESVPANLGSLLTLTSTTHTTAGDYPSDAWTFAGNTNYKAASGTIHNIINKAASVTTVTAANAAYDNNTHGGTATVTGIGGLSQSLTVTYTGISGTAYGPSTTAPTNAGSYNAAASFTGDANHNPSSDNKDFTIGKATPVITLTVGGSVTYDGAPHYVTSATVTGVNNTSLGNAIVAYTKNASSVTDPTDAGDYSVTANFAGDNNYNAAAQKTGTLTIDKAPSVTKVTIVGGPFSYTGSPITPATVSVTGAGSLSLTPSANYANNTAAGTATASYSFTGDDNHLASSDSKNFTIDKATPVITWNSPASIKYGVALSGTQLNASTTVGGSFSYTPAAGSYLHAGNGQSLSVTFTPADAANYNTANQTTTIDIAKADATISVNGYNNTFDGNPHGATGTATGARGEILNSLLHLGSSYTNVPGGTANWTFDGDADHNSANGSVTIQINKASSSVIVTGSNTFTYNGTAQGPSTSSHSGSNGAISFSYSGTTNGNVPYGPVTAAPTTAGSYSVTATLAGDNDHNGAVSDAFAFTIDKATTATSITITGSPFTYTGSAITPATVSVTGPGGLSLTPTATYTNNINAGSASASYSYAGDDNYKPSSDTKPFTIGKATPDITVTPYTVTYDANAHTATGTAKGVLGETLTGLNLSGTTHTSAGATTDSWTFTDASGNYNNATGTVSDKINKASSAITITVSDATYDVSAHGGSATVNGVGGLNQSLAVTYSGVAPTVYSSATAPTNAGTYTISASYDGDDNHEGSSNNKSFTIGKANATVTVQPYTVTYDAAAHTSTGSATGVGGVNLSGLDLNGTTHTGAGDYNDSWTFTDVTGNYNNALGTVTNKINKASSVTTLTVTDATYDGNIHGGSAVATGVGGLNQSLTITYSGTNGTSYGPLTTAPTNAGDYSAVATFAGDDNHNTSTDTKAFKIDKATPVITWNNPSGITYGTALSATQLNASANVAGTLTYLPAAGTYLAAGNGQTLSVEFTPTDGGNYKTKSATVTINVAKATATIVVAGYTGSYDGQSHGAALTSATGARNEDLSSLVSFTNNSYKNVPGGTANWSFAGDDNHNPSSGTAAVTINKATPAISLNIGGAYTYDGTAHGVISAAVSGVTVNGTPEALGNATVTYDGNAGAPINAGDYAVVATFAGNSNYVAAANQTGTLTINKADAQITVTPYDITYDGNQHVATATALGVESMPANLSSLFTLTGTAHTAAGSYSDSWSFSGNANYNSKSGTITDKIAKANATISVTPYDVTYDGNSHTSTGSAKGVKGETLSGLNLTGTTHTNADSYSDTWTFTDATGNYNDASNQVTNKIGKADATINVSGYTGTYDGNAHGATGTATGIGGVNLSSNLSLGNSFINYPGGTAYWTFTGGTNYNDKNGNVAIVINKANATIIVTPYDVTFDNNDHTATATAVGVESTPVNLAILLDLSGTTHKNAGDYIADAWTFAGNNNYNASNGTVHNKIGKAPSVTTVTVSDVIYDGGAHGGTATVTGVGGLNQPVTVSYSGRNGTVYGPSNTAPTNAGSYNATATFGGDANHNTSTDTKSFTIGKADQIITITTPAPASTVYKSGFTVAANASSGLGVTYSSDLPLSNTGANYTMTSGTGTGKVRINQPGNENYNAAPEVVVDVLAEKATQTITWTTPAAIDYPAALGLAQLNASVAGLVGGSAPGSLTYSPISGTILAAGPHTLTVTAAATADYAEATKTVQITVNKGTPVITWNNPSGITYGDLLGNTQLNATASVPGTLVYTPASGTLLSAGNNQQLSVSFTPADADNYNTTGKTVSINVAKATPTITVTVGGPFTYNGNTQGIQSATVAGVLVNGTPEVLGNAVIAYKQNNLAATPLNAGTYQVCASFAGNNNYNSASDNTKSMTIDKANQTITWNNPANIVYGTPLSITQLNANVTGVAGGTAIGAVTYAPIAGTILHAGNGQSLTVNVAATNNYNAATKTVSIDVDKFTPVITLVPGGPYTYDNTTHPAQTVSISKVGSDLISADVVYKDANNVTVSPAPVNAGTYTVQASFAGNSDYNSASKTCSLVINKANQLITWNNPSNIVYGTALTSAQLNAVVAGVSGGDAIGTVTYTPAAGTVLHAGANHVLKVDVAATANYNAATQTVSITVDKFTPTVSINPGGPYQYDGAAHPVVGSSVSGVNGDALTATISYTDANNVSVTPAPKEAGSYTALASFAGNSDYNAASKSCTLTITKASSSVSMSDVTATYDGQPHGATATATAVNVSNPTVTYLYTGTGTTVYNSSNAPVNAGTYSVTASYAGDANHVGSSSTKMVTISQATPTVTVTVAPLYTYNGAPQGATATGVAGVGSAVLGMTVTYQGVSPTSYTGSTPPVNAGNYKVTVAFDGSDANYAPASANQLFTINKADAHITVNPYDVVYDGNAHTSSATATGVESSPANLIGLLSVANTTHTNASTYNNDAWTFTGNTNYNSAGGTVNNRIQKADPAITVTGYDVIYNAAEHIASGSAVGAKGEALAGLNLNNTKRTNAGTTSDAWSFTDVTGNYNNKSGNVTDKIGKADAIVTVNGYTGTYDGVAHGATGSATGVGGVNLMASLNLGSSFTNAPGGTASWTFTGGTNYNDQNGSVSISIGKATPVITLTVGNAPTYDGNPHFVTSATIAGINSTSLGNATVTYSQAGNSVTSPINAGAYDVAANYAGDINYNPAIQKTGLLTISKRAITVTPNALSKVYGDPNPDYTYTPSEALISGNTFAGALNRIAGETVAGGPYAYTIGTLNAGNNYTVTLNSLTTNKFAITRKSASVTPAVNNKIYGNQDPSLGGNVAGFLSADNIFATYTRTSGENVGTYTISANLTPAGVLSNYDITYNTAVFTINKLDVAVTANSGQHKTYGDVDPAYTFTSSPANASFLPNGIKVSFTGALNRQLGESVGNYNIGQGSLDNTNYNITYTAKDFTIDKKPVTVTVDAGQSKIYGQADPALTYTSSPAVGSALPNGLLVSFGSPLARISGENVGTYAIQQGSVTNSNYDITYTGANFEIKKRPVTITVDAGQTKVYGDAEPLPFKYSVSGLGLASCDEFTGALTRISGETVGNYAINQGTLSIRNKTSLVNAIGNYEVTYNANNLTITNAKTNVDVVTITSSPVQYSDQVTFKATISSATAQSQLNSSGGTVEFRLKTAGGVTTTLGTSVYPADWDASAGTVTKTFNIMYAPGTYTVIAAFTPNDALNFSGSVLPNCGALTVNQENATIDYTGDVLVSTGSSSSTTANITLRANISDINVTNPTGDPNPGNIKNAKVRFIVTTLANGNVLTSAWLPVDSLVINGDNRIGTVKTILPVTLSGTDEEYNVRVQVGYDGISDYQGYYIASEEKAVVTVYQPSGDFITGGGTLINTNSVGTMKADVGSKTNFGFNVKFNKKGTSLQGNLNFVFRRKENDNIVHSYQIKANAMQSLAVNASNVSRQTANFVSKCNITDVTNPSNPVTVGGNKFMYVNMVDNGDPGSKDSISIVLVDGTNDPTILANIIYSSNWVGNLTQMKNLGGGNLVVHSGFNLGTNVQNPEQFVTRANTMTIAPEAKFELTAFPNPSADKFTVKVESTDANEPIVVRVYGINGQLREVKKNLTTGQLFQIGTDYRPGVYIIEMIQGNQRKQLKLIKQAD